MLRERISRGVRAGLVAAGATCGALVGVGVRAGAPGRALAVAGQRLRGIPDFVPPDPEKLMFPDRFPGPVRHVAEDVLVDHRGNIFMSSLDQGIFVLRATV